MPFVDRERASRLLAAAGLDALIVAEPEGFSYITGVSQGVPGLFRRAGAGFAVLPADPQRPVGAVIGDLYADAARRSVAEIRCHPLWMENADLTGVPETGPIEQRIAQSWRQAGRPAGFRRPATFDLHLALAALADLLGTLGLRHARLGIDADYIAESDAAVLRDALHGASIVNGSPVLDHIRMVKTADEIDRLALGVELAEAGLRLMAQRVEAGQKAADLRDHFQRGVEAEAARRAMSPPPFWAYIAIGADPWSAVGRVGPGTIVKADVGCLIDGYSSDTSRNYVFGAPTPDQAQLHRSIEAAFAAGVARIRPGVKLSEVHRATTAALEDAGLAGFSRGHFGHGLGHSLFSEQWPFVSATSATVIEPDMVLAFEVPIYVTGVGGFNLEDQLLVTADGHRSMNTLPRHLIPLGG